MKGMACGIGFWASARVLCERVLGLSQSTLGEGFGPESEYCAKVTCRVCGIIILQKNYERHLATEHISERI